MLRDAFTFPINIEEVSKGKNVFSAMYVPFTYCGFKLHFREKSVDWTNTMDIIVAGRTHQRILNSRQKLENK